MTKRLKPYLYENLFCLSIRHKKRFSSKFEFKVILCFFVTRRVWSFWSTLWSPYSPSVKGSKIQVNLIKENRFVNEWSTKSSKRNFSSYILIYDNAWALGYNVVSRLQKIWRITGCILKLFQDIPNKLLQAELSEFVWHGKEKLIFEEQPNNGLVSYYSVCFPPSNLDVIGTRGKGVGCASLTSYDYIKLYNLGHFWRVDSPCRN